MVEQGIECGEAKTDEQDDGSGHPYSQPGDAPGLCCDAGVEAGPKSGEVLLQGFAGLCLQSFEGVRQERVIERQLFQVMSFPGRQFPIEVFLHVRAGPMGDMFTRVIHS
jgi:hypothetical protein